MPDDLSNILESTEVTRLVTGLASSEGPLWHPEGYLTFVDNRSSLLLRWDPSGGVKTVLENTGEANGCTFDRQGRMVMCEGADNRRRITRMGADGSISTIAERWQGKRLNRPNDIICRWTDGSIYFTDPGLRVPPEQRELDFSGVFCITRDGQLRLGTDECEYPNGLALSPDESVLYVAISRLDDRCFREEERHQVCRHRRIRAFDVESDGTLSHNRVFADMSSAEPGVPDGMKVDTQGRVFCTGSGGIWVLDRSGTRLGVIRVPEVPRNLAFGGPDYRTMFITAGVSLYSLRVKTPGIGAH
jgi:gluconolactonase